MGKQKKAVKAPSVTVGLCFEGQSLEDLEIIAGATGAETIEPVIKSVIDIGTTVLMMAISGNFDQFVFRNNSNGKIAFIDDILRVKIGLPKQSASDGDLSEDEISQDLIDDATDDYIVDAEPKPKPKPKSKKSKAKGGSKK